MPDSIQLSETTQVELKPLLSIITILYNARHEFDLTASSLPDPLPAGVEWIVVDGGSSDGSVERVQENAYRLKNYISEPDNGIADAFNKGIGMARGRYLLFLNAGDRLLPECLNFVLPQLAATAAPLWVGRIRMDGRNHGRPVKFYRQLMRNHLPHQAMLIRSSLFDEYGMYDASFRLGMDYEWSLRLRPLWDQVIFTSEVLSEMEPGGVSVSNYRKTFASYHRGRLKHGFNPILSKLMEIIFVGKIALGRAVRRVRLG